MWPATGRSGPTWSAPPPRPAWRDRVDFLGAVDDEQLLALYRDALAVLYPPYDEDFGYVTLEAFLSRKPVVTAVDSGGPNEFVVDGVNGFVRAPEPEAFAEAINALARDRAAGRRRSARPDTTGRGPSPGTA